MRSDSLNLAEQLREREQELQALDTRHGGSGHWVDPAFLQRRQTSWRSRLSRWFGDAHAADNRRNAAEQLLQLADTNSDLVHQQVGHEPLRTWQIEDFGDARLKLLESHGLCNGDQLRAHIDRLQALPGLGAGLQKRLRTRLDQVVQRLEARASAAGLGPGREDLVLLPELLALQNGEQQLQAISRTMATFTAAIAALQTTIRERRCAMQVHLKAFETLC